jgi:hypothetical protein
MLKYMEQKLSMMRGLENLLNDYDKWPEYGEDKFE